MFLPGTLMCTLILACVSCTRQVAKTHRKTLQCEYYNASSCENDRSDCREVEYCEHEIRNHCFVLWKMNATGEYVQLKGCFANNIDCYDQLECVDKRMKPTRNVMFCCCERDMCNRNFTWVPTPTPPPKTSIVQKSQLLLEIYFTISMLTITITLIVLYGLYKHRQLSEPVKLIKIQAKGRFGPVWKAQYNSRTVAVKIFLKENVKFWITELEIYNLPQMGNSYILEFIGIEKRGDPQTEYWLVTAFHEKGSLYDYLKANVVTWTELCKITESIATALAFLHEEMPPSRAEGYKPPIAHRDFKSKNVLLRPDLTACIANFGLALAFHTNEPPDNTISRQVGAIRYMAPEELRGDMLYSRDAFFRIDMYACGLVLWELASRCTAHGGPVSEYMQAFEKEVGPEPTLKYMRDFLVEERRRPVIKDTWRQHPGFSTFCDTIQECWDFDAEARLTAACILERLHRQYR